MGFTEAVMTLILAIGACLLRDHIPKVARTTYQKPPDRVHVIHVKKKEKNNRRFGQKKIKVRKNLGKKKKINRKAVKNENI